MPSATARLVVAASAAFAVTFFAVSCVSTEPTATCSPATCQGCCVDGVCKDVLAQDPAACGTGGAECQACIAGQSCTNGACGHGGGGNGTCGARGQACCAQGSTCLTGLTCQSGVCGDPPSGGGTISNGEPCTSDGQCKGGRCFQAGFTGGYCTQSCTTTADCEAGSTCGRDPTDSSARVCLKACSTSGSAVGCRAGYVCDKRFSFDQTPQCVPKCDNVSTCGEATQCIDGLCCGALGYACCGGTTCDAGLTCTNGYCASSAAGPVGAACNDGAAQCSSGKCQVEIPKGTQGHPYCETADCWPDGYCTQDCSDIGTACGPGTACSFVFNDGLCLDLCTYDGGAGGCRTGYVCDRGLIAGDRAAAACVSACASDADCRGVPADENARCVNGFCCGIVGYSCCGGVAGSCTQGTCGSLGLCE